MALNLQEIDIIIHCQVEVLFIGIRSIDCDVILVVLFIEYVSLIEVLVALLERKMGNGVVHGSIEVAECLTTHLEAH